MKHFLKIISIVLINMILISDIAFAIPYKDAYLKTSYSKKALALDINKILIPSELGEVRSKFTGNKGKIVIHIQDAHCNYEAQINISKLLQYLMLNYRVQFISVEGAERYIDTSWFKLFPDAAARDEAARRFVEKGEFTGVEFAAITTDHPFKLFGAEDRKSYLDDLEVLLKSYAGAEEVKKYFAALKAALNKIKKYIYNGELTLLEEKSREYSSKSLSFNGYISFLGSQARKFSVDLSQFNDIAIFLDVLALERTIDFKAADKEREALLDALAGRLGPYEILDLSSKSQSYKTNKISSAEYHAYLRSLASKTLGTDLDKEYRDLGLYITYNEKYSTIDKRRLFSSVEALEEALKEKAFKNDDQRSCDRLSKDIDAALALVDIALVNKAFTYYQAHKGELLGEELPEFIKKKVSQYGIALDIQDAPPEVAETLSNFETFYNIAKGRDRKLIDNTLSAMDRDGAEAAVLVTGGFHTEGMTKILEEEGVSYIVVSPRMTRPTTTPYLQALARYNATGEMVAKASSGEDDSSLAPILRSYILSGGINERSRDALKLAWLKECAEAYLEGRNPDDFSPDMIAKIEANCRARGMRLSAMDRGMLEGLSRALSVAHAGAMSISKNSKYYSPMSEKDGEPVIIRSEDNPNVAGLTAAEFGAELLKRRDRLFRPLAKEFYVNIKGKQIRVIVEKGIAFGRDKTLKNFEIRDLIIKAMLHLGEDGDEGFAGNIPDLLVITLLDRSPSLFEDHIGNGFIGVNRALFEEIKRYDPKHKDILLRVGLVHELCHEMSNLAGDLFEKILLQHDAQYAALLMSDLNVKSSHLAKAFSGILEDDRMVSAIRDAENLDGLFKAPVDEDEKITVPMSPEKQALLAREMLGKLRSAADRDSVNSEIGRITDNSHPVCDAGKIDPAIFIREYSQALYYAHNEGERRDAFEALASSLRYLDAHSFNERGAYEIIPEVREAVQILLRQLGRFEDRETIKEVVRTVVTWTEAYPWIIPLIFKARSRLKASGTEAMEMISCVKAITARYVMYELDKRMAKGFKPPNNKEFMDSISAVSHMSIAFNGPDGMPTDTEKSKEMRLKAIFYLGEAARCHKNAQRVRSRPYRSERERAMMILWRKYVKEFHDIGRRLGAKSGYLPEDILQNAYIMELQKLAASYARMIEMMLEAERCRDIGMLASPVFSFEQDHKIRIRAGRRLFWLAVFGNPIAKKALRFADKPLMDELSQDWEEANMEIATEFRLSIPRVLLRADIYSPKNNSNKNSPDMAFSPKPHEDVNKLLKAQIKEGNVYHVRALNDSALKTGVWLEHYEGDEGSFRRIAKAVKGYFASIRLWFTVYKRLEKIRAAGGILEKAAASPMFNASDLAGIFGTSKEDASGWAANMARGVDINVVEKRFTLYDNGPVAHTRRGISGQNALIWLGEGLFTDKDITDEDIALVLLEEAKHIIAPDAVDGKIAHSPELLRKLLNRAVEAKETASFDTCRPPSRNNIAPFEEEEKVDAKNIAEPAGSQDIAQHAGVARSSSALLSGLSDQAHDVTPQIIKANFENGRMLMDNARASLGDKPMRIIFLKSMLPRDMSNAGAINNILNDCKKYYSMLGCAVNIAEDIDAANSMLSQQGWDVKNTIICIDREALKNMKAMRRDLNRVTKILALERPSAETFVPVSAIFDLAALLVRINGDISQDALLKTQLENFMRSSGIEITGDIKDFIQTVMSGKHKEDPIAFAEKFTLKLPPIKPANIRSMPENYKAMKQALEAA